MKFYCPRCKKLMANVFKPSYISYTCSIYCKDCNSRATTAMKMADMAANQAEFEMPKILEDLFKR